MRHRRFQKRPMELRTLERMSDGQLLALLESSGVFGVWGLGSIVYWIGVWDRV